MKVISRELDLRHEVIRLLIEVPLDETPFVHLRGLNADMDDDDPKEN